jgi:hypothetical protein
MGVGGCFFCLFSLRQRKRGEGGSCMKNKEKQAFLWFFPRLIVPLTSSKVLTFGKTQINLVFRSLIRTFAALYY